MEEMPNLEPITPFVQEGNVHEQTLGKRKEEFQSERDRWNQYMRVDPLRAGPAWAPVRRLSMSKPDTKKK